MTCCPTARVFEIFAARVIVPKSDFARLGLDIHERPASLPACFRWCHANLGTGGTRWSVMLRNGADALVYFAEVRDAVAFLVRWSDDAVLEQLPLAAQPELTAAAESEVKGLRLALEKARRPFWRRWLG